MSGAYKDAAWYRERGHEVLAIREGMADPTCRHTLALVAENWRLMADQIERMQENELKRKQWAASVSKSSGLGRDCAGGSL